MVAKRKRKYTEGQGSKYMSRRAAMNKLQLTLKDFRKLCILKGVYPREPTNRKRAQKGAPGIKILYLKKDIQFLMHEPIIWKLRDYKIFAKRVGRAKALRDFRAMRNYLNNHPQIKIDHIVKERYPTFIDAVRDLDDCLTLCFLFSTFPSMKSIPPGQSQLCRRLTIEFMHAVIAAKALRKVFISIKGYYFQAEIKGQMVTWIVPHYFAHKPQSSAQVDFKVMAIFVEFYSIMLGFTNFRLYHSLNLFYPPKFPGYSVGSIDTSLIDEESFVSERIAALNVPLSRTGGEIEEEEEPDFDHFQMTGDPEKQEQMKLEFEKNKRLKTLFKGLKLFLNREVPREPLVFVIRCFGGDVSWDKVSFVGSTFDESDETITHQIVDRPSLETQYLSRYYVQPQWIFDSVNACELLPVQKYFIGAILPPHLSPFINPIQDNIYVPPEAKALEDAHKAEKQDSSKSDDEEVEDDDDEDEEIESEQESDTELKDEPVKEHQDKEMDSEERARLERRKKMVVSAGTIVQEDPKEKIRQERQEYKLREKMIKKKHRNLYKSMMKGRQKRSKEVWLLEKKRRRIDTEEADKKKVKITAKSNESFNKDEKKVKGVTSGSISQNKIQKKTKVAGSGRFVKPKV